MSDSGKSDLEELRRESNSIQSERARGGKSLRGGGVPKGLCAQLFVQHGV